MKKKKNIIIYHVLVYNAYENNKVDEVISFSTKVKAIRFKKELMDYGVDNTDIKIKKMIVK